MRYIALPQLGSFFFQEEDGIRDYCVTGVQTCALPICAHRDLVLREPDEFRPVLASRHDAPPQARTRWSAQQELHSRSPAMRDPATAPYRCSHISQEIGRASCRERV